MSHEHLIERCIGCDAIIAQCRCADRNKATLRKALCQACQLARNTVPKLAPDPPAAPGVTKEVEEAIKALEWSVNYESPGHQEDARAALLAAIEKYGEARYTQGVAHTWVKEARID